MRDLIEMFHPVKCLIRLWKQKLKEEKKKNFVTLYPDLISQKISFLARAFEVVEILL